MKKHCTWAVIMVLLGTGASMIGAQDSGVSAHPMIGDEAPAFNLEEVGGGNLSLESLKGRYVILHFGASW